MTQRPHQRRGLGRGLGSLIPTAPRPVTDTVGAEPDPAAPPHSDDAASGNRQGDGPEQTFLERQPEALAGTHLERPSDGGTSGDASSAASTATEEPGPEGADPSTPQPEERWTDQDAKDHAVESAPEPSLQSADPSGSPSAEQSADQSTSPSPEDSAEKSWGQSSDLPGDLAPVDGAYFAELPVSAIRPNPRQPRQVFDEDALAELVQSIQQVGLLQPIVVRPAGEGAYELIMGERRWRATQDAGLDTIPAIVRETEDDDLLRDALLENLHRAQLNPLEEAAAYQQLLDDFGCTHEELATRIGRSRPQISNTLRLLKLTPAVQRRVAAGILSAGHARALLGVEDPAAQDRLAGRVVAESISVRGLEELVAVGAIDGDTAAPVRRSKPTAPGLADLAARLSDRLETRVKVDLGKRKGRITVEFASLPDLERIIALIDPEPQTTQDSWATGTGA